jgi:multidrug efflux pump subunit AcrA (membrane-fusion protein)
VEPKQSVKLLTDQNEILGGFVLTVQKQLAYDETEVVVGVTSANNMLKDGEFVAAIISLPREEAVKVVPSSSILRTSEGIFVYAAKDQAYLRTAVKVGSESDNSIEITDGLDAGDHVVTKPVETLWLIELRATKGGGHCH